MRRCAARRRFCSGLGRLGRRPERRKVAGRIEATSKVRGLVVLEKAATDHASPARRPAKPSEFMIAQPPSDSVYPQWAGRGQPLKCHRETNHRRWLGCNSNLWAMRARPSDTRAGVSRRNLVQPNGDHFEMRHVVTGLGHGRGDRTNRGQNSAAPISALLVE